eukprot:g42044.t1
MNLYVAEAFSNIISYLPLDHDPTMAHRDTVSHAAHDLIASGDLSSTISDLIAPQPRIAQLYLLPKIHKPNYPSGPIISTYSSPTEFIFSYLDSILSLLVQTLPTYIQDTSHTLHLFRNFQLPDPQHFIFTMDVQSLYMSIPLKDGLQTLSFFLSNRFI